MKPPRRRGRRRPQPDVVAERLAASLAIGYDDRPAGAAARVRLLGIINDRAAVARVRRAGRCFAILVATDAGAVRRYDLSGAVAACGGRPSCIDHRTFLIPIDRLERKP